MLRRMALAAGLAAGAWPVFSRAKDSVLPVVGFLSTASLPRIAAAFLKGLSDAGYVDGRNVVVEELGADGRYDRLPGLAAQLVNRKVAVIFASGGNAPALAAQAATAQIPIVFLSGGDPVKSGLVTSLSRPGANITGVTSMFNALAPKRLSLLRELVPDASSIGLLVNPDYPDADMQVSELEEAAKAMQRQIRVARARNSDEIGNAIEALAHGVDAFIVANDPFFLSQRTQIAALCAVHATPAMYWEREYVVAGGLISYGPSLTDAAQQAGRYVGRVLDGVKPSELPVLRPSRFELVINLSAAKQLRIAIPEALLLQADEVIR